MVVQLRRIDDSRILTAIALYNIENLCERREQGTGGRGERLEEVKLLPFSRDTIATRHKIRDDAMKIVSFRVKPIT